MSPALKSVSPVDFGVIAAYMALMLGIGVYSMRLNRGASDYFKGGSRIHWLAAGLSSFMSGFSAWTFTGTETLALALEVLVEESFGVKRTAETGSFTPSSPATCLEEKVQLAVILELTAAQTEDRVIEVEIL